MKSGKPYVVEKLLHGRADGQAPGWFLNSPPRWLPVQVIVAESYEDAVREAHETYKDASLRITEDQHGECM